MTPREKKREGKEREKKENNSLALTRYLEVDAGDFNSRASSISGLNVAEGRSTVFAGAITGGQRTDNNTLETGSGCILSSSGLHI